MLSCPWCSSRMAPWHSSSSQDLQTLQRMYEDHDTIAPTGTAILCLDVPLTEPQRHNFEGACSLLQPVLVWMTPRSSLYWSGWLQMQHKLLAFCFWMSRKGALTLPYHGVGSEQWSLKISSRKTLQYFTSREGTEEKNKKKAEKFHSSNVREIFQWKNVDDKRKQRWQRRWRQRWRKWARSPRIIF